MAALDTPRITTGSFGLAGRIGTTFSSVKNAVAEWNDARATRKALNSLTDRELEDIGLCRGDIEGVTIGRR